MSLLFRKHTIMLIKKICKKCWYSTGYTWDKADDKWWNKAGKIFCPIEYTEIEERIQRKITGKPPSKCPFLLEHY